METVRKRGVYDEGADPEVRVVSRSVLPVFTHETERPDRTGSCVLVRLFGYPLILTAAHVLHEARTTEHFAIGVGGSTVGVLRQKFGTTPEDPADVGFVPLRNETAAALEAMGACFLGDSHIRLESTSVEQAKYFIMGYPASGAYSRMNHAAKHLNITAFSARLELSPNDPPSDISAGEHLLFTFDAKKVWRDGRRANAPKLQGMSGGGVFQFREGQPNTTALVGILTEHRRDARVIVATNMTTTIRLGAELLLRHPESFQ